MSHLKHTSNATVLIEELKALIANPNVPSAQRQEIIQLSRKAAVVLEEPFEMLQRLAYSVRLSLRQKACPNFDGTGTAPSHSAGCAGS